jgi:pimeloyl-ACP methyl ester carboxylesterase
LDLQTAIYLLGGLIGLYLIFTLICTYLVQQLPRKSVNDPPDWGAVTDTTIPAIDGGFLEVWRVEPEGSSKGLVVLAHGWSRNRDRMVSRARIFARWGFTTIMHSARDHGNSSRRRFMNAFKFAEDIEAVMKWLNQPIILYGHSAGSAGAIIAASRNPDRVRVLILEASYAFTGEALLSLYRWFNPFFGICFGPMILFWMNLFYRNRLDSVSPARLAPGLKMPVMLIHGENDRRFPLDFALKLQRSFAPGQAELYVGQGAGHSDSSRTAGYKQALKSFLDHHLVNH